jgi:HK97 family phage prohead protease
MRASLIERNGKQFAQLEGTPSVVEVWYEMWDMFGPYEEKIARGAFDNTLSQSPDVSFLLNHKGMTMARTKSSRSLELWVGESGNLETRAFVNPKRQDVADLVTAIEDEDIDQMSFAFRIVAWAWNDDFDQFVITEVDLDRGDVSAVNYGANPNTSISARDALAAIDTLEGPALEAARTRIDARLALRAEEAVVVTPAPSPAGLGWDELALSLQD